MKPLVISVFAQRVIGTVGLLLIGALLMGLLGAAAQDAVELERKREQPLLWREWLVVNMILHGALFGTAWALWSIWQ